MNEWSWKAVKYGLCWIGYLTDVESHRQDQHIRFRATCIKSQDGRLVDISGEHEELRDPDFYIYNGKRYSSSESARDLGSTHPVGILHFSLDLYPQHPLWLTGAGW